MLSLETAQALKNAGLQWEPQLHDTFLIPEAGLDERRFILTDMMSEMTVLKGWPAITFHGVVEWALDYVLQTETVWVPREDQLRSLVEAQVDQLQLTAADNYRCTIWWQDEEHIFTAADASEAYAIALLFLLDKK